MSEAVPAPLPELARARAEVSAATPAAEMEPTRPHGIAASAIPSLPPPPSLAAAIAAEESEDPREAHRAARAQWATPTLDEVGRDRGAFKIVKDQGKGKTGPGSETPSPPAKVAKRWFDALGWTREMRDEFTKDVTAQVLRALGVRPGDNIDDKINSRIDQAYARVSKQIAAAEQRLDTFEDAVGPTGGQDMREIRTRLHLVEDKLDHIVQLIAKRDGEHAARLEHASEQLEEYAEADWDAARGPRRKLTTTDDLPTKGRQADKPAVPRQRGGHKISSF